MVVSVIHTKYTYITSSSNSNNNSSFLRSIAASSFCNERERKSQKSGPEEGKNIPKLLTSKIVFQRPWFWESHRTLDPLFWKPNLVATSTSSSILLGAESNIKQEGGSSSNWNQIWGNIVRGAVQSQVVQNHRFWDKCLSVSGFFVRNLPYAVVQNVRQQTKKHVCNLVSL